MKKGPGENSPTAATSNADAENAHRPLKRDLKAETFPNDADANAKLERPRRKGYELPSVA